MNEADKRDWCLDVLELPDDASMLEVKTSYHHLKDLYTKGSIALSPLEDEYPPETRQEILASIEDAYAWFVANHDRLFHEAPEEGSIKGISTAVRKEVGEVTEFSGASLKDIRQKLGIEPGEVEFATKIGLNHIKNIEDDNFCALPEEVFVKGYLAAYARCLGLIPSEVTEFYMKRYKEAREEKDKPI